MENRNKMNPSLDSRTGTRAGTVYILQLPVPVTTAVPVRNVTGVLGTADIPEHVKSG